MSVRWVRVGEVLRLERRPVEAIPGDIYHEIGVRSFGRGVFHKEPVSGAELGTKRVFRIEPGDLVVSNVFAWEGAVGCATDRERGRIGSHRFMTWVPECDNVDVRFVVHFLLSDGGMSQLRRASPGSAGRNRTLAIGGFRELRIPLPDLDEQRRIAARLDAVAAAVSSVEGDASQKIRQLYAGVFAHITPGRPLGDLLVLDDTECVVDRETTYRRVGVRSHGRGLFLQPPLDGSSTSYGAMRVVRSGQVVLSRLKAFEGAVGMAEADHEGAVVSPEFHTFRLRRPELDTFYVRALIRLPSVWEQLKAASTGVGARRERVRAEALLAVEVPIPSGDERRRVAVQCQAIERVEALWGHRQRGARALLPAARNEEFSRLTSA